MGNFSNKIIILISILFSISSCSNNEVLNKSLTVDNTDLIKDYNYTSEEIETMQLINEYRISIGLNVLDKINHVSYKSEEHNIYMINENNISHDNFINRSENIIKTLSAKKVSENVAYNYNSPEGVLNAWLNSPEHKKNIEGDHTHFGISISKHPTNGRRYYTNIFVKL